MKTTHTQSIAVIIFIGYFIAACAGVLPAVKTSGPVQVASFRQVEAMHGASSRMHWQVFGVSVAPRFPAGLALGGLVRAYRFAHAVGISAIRVVARVVAKTASGWQMSGANQGKETQSGQGQDDSSSDDQGDEQSDGFGRDNDGSGEND